MLRVAICTSSEADRQVISGLAERYCNRKSVPVQILKCGNGMELCDEVGDGNWFDVVFLDIMAKPESGVEVARRLRRLRYAGKIVFCAAAPVFHPERFDVGAAGYLLQPYGTERFFKTMDRLVHAVRTSVYPVKCRSKLMCVPQDEILYVESQNSRCILHQTGGRTYTIYKKLDEIKEELNAECFLRCHRSYLVNLNHVVAVDKQFILSSGDAVLIRQKQLKEMRQAYLDYTAQMTCAR